SLEELREVAQAVKAPRLMAGFNRRFSPLLARLKDFFAASREPKFISCRVNAGAVTPESWVLDPVEGGGRIIGEVCHFVDLICYLTGAAPRRVFAESLAGPGHPALERDSVAITLRMSDNSVGVIHYLANGDASLPKEYIEMFGGQRAAILDNFRSLALHHGNRRRRHRLVNQAKGHAEEVAAFMQSLENGGPMPIDFETLMAVTQTTFLIHRSLDLGCPVDYYPG
ncbi:MAG TPA: hypothetical protein VKG02_11190, partial [Blastocatellia bacterium]|nr:hypothetical protein [Blastocatellia bacterium]